MQHRVIMLGLVAGMAAWAGCSGAEPEGQSAAATEATIHSFECETQWALDDGFPHSARFGIRALERPQDLDLLWPDDEDELPVTVAPEGSDLEGLNENIVAYLEDGKLTISGDSDGFYLSKLVLYQNSGFTKGYMALTDLSDSIGGDQYAKVDCEVAEQKPFYTLETDHLLGIYEGDEFCEGGFGACTDAEITQDDSGHWSIELGGGDYWDGYIAELHEANGVLVFSTGDRYDWDGPDFDDCQDPGCGDMLKMSGVLYPKKIDGQWVTTLKVYYTIDFPYPDDYESPDGIVKGTAYLSQAG